MTRGLGDAYATNNDHPEQISNHRRGAEGHWKLLSCRRPLTVCGRSLLGESELGRNGCERRTRRLNNIRLGVASVGQIDVRARMHNCDEIAVTGLQDF
jgi:hypothetical protein